MKPNSSCSSILKSKGTGSRVAVIQPYFYPYCGYFGLLQQVDVCVFLTDVQFQRRGWVHRNRILNPDKVDGWQYINIPIKKTSRETKICDMLVSEDEKWRERMLEAIRYRYPDYDQVWNVEDGLYSVLQSKSSHLADYSCNSIKAICRCIGINEPEFIDSRTLNIPASFDKTERIIQIVKKLGASSYYNLPGGKLLYQKEDFQRHGITLGLMDDMKETLVSSGIGMFSILDPLNRGMCDSIKKKCRSVRVN